MNANPNLITFAFQLHLCSSPVRMDVIVYIIPAEYIAFYEIVEDNNAVYQTDELSNDLWYICVINGGSL